jgi:hypothetical protein
MEQHSISIQELIKRGTIRSDMPYGFLNKMTNEEIFKWEHEVDKILETEGVVHKSKDYKAKFKAKTKERQILYNSLKEGKTNE